MNTKTLTAIALLLAAIPAASFAQDATSPARPTPPTFDFAAADTDGSGGISAEEWTAYASTLRDAARAEMIGTRADALIEAADADGDGTLSREELVSGMIAMADQRREGWEDRRGQRGERFAMLHDDDDRRPGMRDDMRGRMEGRMRGHDDDDRGGMRERMERQMAGHGGERRDEARGDRMGRPMGDRAMMGFNRIDADGDGQISTEELAQAQEWVNWMAQRPVRN